MKDKTEDSKQNAFKSLSELGENIRKNFIKAMGYDDDKNIPDHYKIGDLDIMEIIIEIVKNNNLDIEGSIYLFNTLKYLVRFGNKDRVKDLEKAKDYLNRLIEVCEVEG